MYNDNLLLQPVEVESTVKESITAPEPTTLRSSEVDALTSPELPKEPTTPVILAEPDVSSTVPASSTTSTPTQPPPSEKRKLVRIVAINKGQSVGGSQASINKKNQCKLPIFSYP